MDEKELFKNKELIYTDDKYYLEFDEDKIDEIDDEFEGILDLFRDMPKPTFQVLNFKRFMEMIETAKNMQRFMLETSNDFKISISVDHEFNSGCISFEATDFIISDYAKFSKIIEKASVMDIYAKTYGNTMIELTFHKIFLNYY